MDAIGGIEDYQRLDKVCDLAYMFVFLVVSLRWVGLERSVAVAAWHHYRPGRPLASRQAALALVALLLGKEAQEYFLHYDRFLDQFSAFDAVIGIWRWITGGR
ncbi:MAG: hypothetical protein E6J38_00120 [Chloroflexi bacterium]|nr:MAG: hypothetical protein E6J38_00120 [Chloroflexota bacterium]